MKHRLLSLGLTFLLVTALTFTSYALAANNAKQQNIIVRMNPEYKTATFIRDNWSNSNRSLSSQQLIWSYLNARKNLLKFTDAPQNHFQLLKTQVDNLNMTHYRLQEVYQGTPVYGSVQTVHVKNTGVVTSFFGQVVPNIHLKRFSSTNHISGSQAVALVKKDLYGKQYLHSPTARLFIYPYKRKPVYAYLVKAVYLYPEPAAWEYFVDATNGKILHKLNTLDEMTGKGKGVNGEPETFEISKQGNLYYLNDLTRRISTYDANHEDENSPVFTGKMVSSSNDYFTDGAAVDAHAFAEKTFDFYKKNFNRNSFDDKGTPIKSYIHVGSKWNNAAWDGQEMIYGDGDGKTFTEMSGGLDVVAHELTHAVTQNTANLQYELESGALNESISDIMGVMVDSKNWLLGEDIYTPGKRGDALRSMSDPKKYGQPDNYQDRYIGIEDNGGVHTNSGINNKAAYLIAAGGSQYGVTVQGIGRPKTAAIYYRALTLYLTPTSDFQAMRDAAIQAATDLYGENSNEVTTVQNAYDAVGVGSDD